MAVTAEAAFEQTGNFENDYVSGCMRSMDKPMRVLKLAREYSDSIRNAETSISDAKEQKEIKSDQSVELMRGMRSLKSKFRFTPTIVLDSCCFSERDQSDHYEMINEKLSINGWKIKCMEAICMPLSLCTNITHLSFYNCGMNEPHFLTLLASLPSSFVFSIAIDQNPLIPETLYTLLLEDDSLLRSVSLRSNGITCAGAKLMATALKNTNRTLTNLNLWNNSIGKEGVEAFADALRYNTSLNSLSFGNNPQIGDEGVNSLQKVLSNTPLANDELASKKKIILAMELLKKEQDEDGFVKKGKAISRQPTSGGQIAKKTASNSRTGKGLGDDDTNKEKSASTIDASKKKPGKAAAAVKPKIEEKATLKVAALGKKAAGSLGSNSSVAEDQKVERNQKSGKKEAKPDLKSAKGKRGPLSKGQSDDTKDEIDEIPEACGNAEPMFESNGQWNIIGNRTLGNLNLSGCNISESGLHALNEIMSEQDACAENSSLLEASLGLFRISLQDNLFDTKSQMYLQLQDKLSARSLQFVESLRGN